MSNLNYGEVSSSQRVDSTNLRIYERNIPSQILQPYLSVRPVMTKYSIMPIVDPRAPIHVPMEQLPIYNTEKVFNPGNATAPWSGYASNVNVESDLQNRIFALQKCSQSVYVPDSNSDLYNFAFKPNKEINQPFPYLFKNEDFSEFNPNTENIAHGLFQNSTRQQLKNVGDQYCNKNVYNCVNDIIDQKNLQKDVKPPNSKPDNKEPKR
jgi:hypothetical protein